MGVNILVTGTNGGIGKYIHEKVGGIGFTRQSNNLDELKKKSFEVIIHCAWNYMPTRLVTNDNLGRYFYDNVLLTQELLKIRHGCFVFFSTIDLYPNNGLTHLETDIIYPDSVRSIHGITKLLSESLVREQSEDFIILRPVFLLGASMRKNNLLRLIDDSHPILSLDESSRCNIVLYADVLDFINTALFRRERGIFNLSSVGGITLSRIAEIMDKKVVFGSHHYDSGDVSNCKAIQLSPAFKKTSEEVFQEFIAERNKFPNKSE